MSKAPDHSKTTNLRHNLLIAPVVFFVRVPLLLPFWLIARAGEYAEAVGDFISDKIPGFRR